MIYKQLFGRTKSNAFPTTLLQDDWAVLFKYVKFTFCNLIPVHGFLALQSYFVAIGVDDVPRILSDTISLILIPDTYTN